MAVRGAQRAFFLGQTYINLVIINKVNGSKFLETHYLKQIETNVLNKIHGDRVITMRGPDI